MLDMLHRTSLHRALYLGHLSAAALLLDAGALLSIQDYKVLSRFLCSSVARWEAVHVVPGMV